jgi:hypothetical protein
VKKFVGAVLFVALVAVLGTKARAEGDKSAGAILDKAIKALGGEEKLSGMKGASWKAKGTISFGGSDNAMTTQSTSQGLDHFRQDFEGDFGGMKIMGSTVLAGDKGWRKFNDMTMELDKDAVASTKRNLYLQLASTAIVPLKSKEFKVSMAEEEKVDGKPAVGIKVVGPDGKDFKMFFDKESGLPVKQIAKVNGFMGEEFTQETTFGGYKDFDGIKKATKAESKRDGEKFMSLEITEFKALKEVDPKVFAEPK